MISVKIILDSVSQAGTRITTMELVMPRIILAEFNTHRAFSRNSASSRAVSVEKKIREVEENPFIPLVWGLNEKGMQANTIVDKEKAEEGEYQWLWARDKAVGAAQALHTRGFHKQVINRLLEPFLWHTVLVTATEWENFFDQRCSPLAEPHMEMLANKMIRAMEDSIPIVYPSTHWHLPFVDGIYFNRPKHGDSLQDSILVSAARCARVSYQKHGQETKWEDDLKIGNSLLSANPPHWSPFEHQAMASFYATDKYANFTGWQQARHHSIIKNL